MLSNRFVGYSGNFFFLFLIYFYLRSRYKEPRFLILCKLRIIRKKDFICTISLDILAIEFCAISQGQHKTKS